MERLPFAIGIGMVIGVVALLLAIFWFGPVLFENPPGPVAIAPTLANVRCDGTRLSFDLTNPGDVGVNASVAYGGTWTGWGDFWVPPKTTLNFVVDQGVSCANAFPLTIQGWGIAEECPWPAENTRWRCGLR